MTEKRYKLIESDPCEDPYDCRMYIGILEDDVEELYDYKSICDRLNELAKENEQLKQENIDLRKDLGEFEKSINIQGLIGENEQLKAKNDGLEKDLQETMNIFNELNALVDENEQLKEGMIRVVDRYIKNIDCNPPSSTHTYMKIKGALLNIREDLRDLIEDLE